MQRPSLVIFSSLPDVGGHTTTTLKLCEILRPVFGAMTVLVKEIPSHGTSAAAAQVLDGLSVDVLPCPGGDPAGWLRMLGRLRRPDVFLAIGMRHQSPLLALTLGAKRSVYYHITHELSPAMRRQLRAYRSFFSELVFLSPATAKMFGGTHSAWAVQPTGLPVAPREARTRTPGPPRFGFLGRLNDAKGLGMLSEIVKTSTAPCELHVAGRGPGERALAALLREAPERFFLHGTFGADERAEFLYRFFEKIDCLCVPSLDDREGIPNVILEALQFGVPVLATPSGGVRSFAMPELGPADPSVIELVAAVDFREAFTARLAAPPPAAATREACRAYFERFFSDAVLAGTWRHILGLPPA